MRSKYKAFHQAIDKLREDYNKHRGLLKDKRVTQAERLILKSYIEIRNNNYQKVFEYLKNCHPTEKYFKAHKNLVMGIAYNNITNYEDSTSCFMSAEQQFDHNVDIHFVFFLYLNWYYLASNTRNLVLSKQIITKVNKISAQLSLRFEALRVLINFDFLSQNGEVRAAIKKNNELKKIEHNLYHADQTSLIVMRFNFYVSIQDFLSAKQELSNLKSLRKNQLTENYKYMSSLLKFLMHDEPLYIREIEIKRTTYLYQQIKVLKLILNHDLNAAQTTWNNLANKYPKLYQDEFQYHGGNDLFNHSLKKVLILHKQYSNKPSHEINFDATKKSSLTTNDLLGEIFSDQDLIISKDDLFKLLYKREAMTLSDDNKLAKVISRYRKKTDKNIRSKNGYFQYKTISEKSA
jgi:hypothetical protein